MHVHCARWSGVCRARATGGVPEMTDTEDARERERDKERERQTDRQTEKDRQR